MEGLSASLTPQSSKRYAPFERLTAPRRCLGGSDRALQSQGRRRVLVDDGDLGSMLESPVLGGCNLTPRRAQLSWGRNGPGSKAANVMVETQNVTATDRVSESSATDALDEKTSPGTTVARTLSRSDIGRLISKDYVGLRLLITRRTGDPQIAADLLNDAVCTTWEKWSAGQIQRPNQIAGYIFQVAMNLLRNHRRGIADRPDRRADNQQLDLVHVGADVSDQQFERQIAHRLKKIILSMDSPRDRAVLVRFYLNEEEKASICGDLRLSPLQFDKVLHRARRRLREVLESQGLTRADFLSVLWVMCTVMLPILPRQ